MKLSDFKIGLEFICGPFWWRCTDVGTRTVTAIRLVEDDPVWYEGPPYMVEEVVLNEAELDDAHLIEEDHIRASIAEARSSGHPNFPHEALMRMMEARLEGEPYPRKGLFRFDRVRADGEILHPYAGRRADDSWIICFYLPFMKEWGEMQEVEFIALPIAANIDVKQRAAQSPQPRRI
ncbi:hypothetical protein I6G56_00200 (plasmid) [Burkholderia humptydooensis]|uniref:Uncharacterized protein n=2 Tax=Burkholderia humptydooensis TaxID=430531 RepID=A0A7U4P7Z3_9BURK|nr:MULTISPECIES: hypothetical protein [Burkholderia]AJY38197.1 hypothetical protein BW21_6359 [Burkholderia sp. 2002721687]ALX44632.1 hypothetical protein AQ610_19020 [Burkholderia humptydooensis]QPS41986.1 hypothetical protein I6G56_00200 [Burkholderia humptydooensis]